MPRLAQRLGFERSGEVALKFGIRKPSIRKVIAARTSPARLVRHSLGLKAPRGYGGITDPKRALYNRVYSRTTVSGWSLLGAVLRGLLGGRR